MTAAKAELALHTGAVVMALVALLLAPQAAETFAFFLDTGSVADNKFTAQIPTEPDPIELPGNPPCAEIDPSWREFRIEEEDIESGTYLHDGIQFTLANVTETHFDWSTTAGMDAVMVKGGPNLLLYNYSPEATADTGLHPPLKPNGVPYGISHINFCYDLV